MKRRGGKHNGRLLHFIIFNDILIEDKRRYEQEKRERKKREKSSEIYLYQGRIKISQKEEK